VTPISSGSSGRCAQTTAAKARIQGLGWPARMSKGSVTRTGGSDASPTAIEFAVWSLASRSRPTPMRWTISYCSSVWAKAAAAINPAGASEASPNENRNRCKGSEVYAGGASVALSLLFEEYASHIHINDLNRSVAAFWRVVLADPDALCRLIRSAPATMTEWRRQKAIQAAPNPDDLDLAFSTFYLNRTARSGIISGGVIGGQDQTGPWKLDARLNREDLIRRIERIGRFAGRITLTSLDAADYLRTQLPLVPRPFVYLDPPYFTKGEGLYENFYKYKNHVEIAELVRGMKSEWLVSYHNQPEVGRLYSGYRRRTYSLSYSAADRYQGSEVMFFSPGLTIPRVASPARIPTGTVADARLARVR
jgi:DNA adenine methylase